MEFWLWVSAVFVAMTCGVAWLLTYEMLRDADRHYAAASKFLDDAEKRLDEARAFHERTAEMIKQWEAR